MTPPHPQPSSSGRTDRPDDQRPWRAIVDEWIRTDTIRRDALVCLGLVLMCVALVAGTVALTLNAAPQLVGAGLGVLSAGGAGAHVLRRRMKRRRPRVDLDGR
jgi:hypothetical protein